VAKAKHAPSEAERFHKEEFQSRQSLTEDLFDWEEKGAFFGGKNVRIYDSATIIGDVKLGDNVWIGPGALVDGSGGLEIGSWVDVSAGVKIFTHDTVKRALSGGKHPTEKAPVKIGDCTFIGTDTIILKGVKIGSRCVIAANSLVNKSFPDNSVIAGVPSKRIGSVIVDGDKVTILTDKEKNK
jgi:acetyltransferase-like isoleucine patch superfamily enzyme